MCDTWCNQWSQKFASSLVPEHSTLNPVFLCLGKIQDSGCLLPLKQAACLSLTDCRGKWSSYTWRLVALSISKVQLLRSTVKTEDLVSDDHHEVLDIFFNWSVWLSYFTLKKGLGGDCISISPQLHATASPQTQLYLQRERRAPLKSRSCLVTALLHFSCG